MKLKYKIASRYLFSHRGANLTNRISWVGVVGIALGSAALVVVLSVFNGFSEVIEQNIEQECPCYLLRPSSGKTFAIGSLQERLDSLPEVSATVAVVEEQVAVAYGDRKAVARLKGLQGAWQCSVQARLASDLGIRTRFLEPLQLYFPKADAKISMLRPQDAVNSISIRPKDIINSNQALVIVPINKARELLGLDEDRASAIEIHCDFSVPDKAAISRIAGEGFEVLDRLEQNPQLYRMMRYEKLAIYLILLLIIIIVSFNIYASLSMLIIEKEQDRRSMKAMGASAGMIKGIFRSEGMLVTLLGLSAGLLAGLLLCLAQAKWGLVQLPGNSFVDFYPVKLKFTDILLSIAAVCAIGFTISYTSTKNIDK